MLREQYSGHNPSHFHINAIVKAYIISESFLWTGWNFVTPILAIFVISNIHGGNIQTAAIAYAIYQIIRVLLELIAGKFLSKSSDRKKILTAIVGIIYLSLGYIGFGYSHTILQLFIFNAFLGIGLGIASPAKNSLFAIHLDRDKEATEWGFADAITFICNALAAVVGGFIAHQYGFPSLFLVAAAFNIVAIIPYLLYLL